MTEALIFDLDGTLVETSHLWIAAEDELLAAAGGERTPEISARFSGRQIADMAEIVRSEFRPEMDIAECAAILTGSVMRRFRSGDIDEMPGAGALLRKLEGRAPMAVASGSSVPLIEMALEKAGLRGFFSELVTSEGLPHGKPRPDVFLEAARRLGVPPGGCVVFEDSLPGLQAAEAAGMLCIVRPRGPHADEIRRRAARWVDSWDEVSLEGVFGSE